MTTKDAITRKLSKNLIKKRKKKSLNQNQIQDSKLILEFLNSLLKTSKRKIFFLIFDSSCKRIIGNG
jgi:hypothetical protein